MIQFQIKMRFIFAFLFAFCLNVSAQTSLNVTNYGAKGDVVCLTVNTVADSAVVEVQTTNVFSSEDVGKLIQLFGVGPVTTETNYQDLIATIDSVSDGTNITISIPPSATSNNVYCVIGTQNAEPFQACVNAAGTNAVINIPNGTYLLVSPLLLTSNYYAASMFGVTPAVTITNGGIRLIGQSTNAVLLGNGAWMLKTNFVQRGTIFFLQGPIHDTGSLSFENLTFDGGVLVGKSAYSYWPGRVTDGLGWDTSHGAVLDIGPTPIQRSKVFTNCNFIHWRGEILKSVTSQYDYLTTLINCHFYDGNASALNFTGTYNVTGCTFDTLDMAMEYYMGYSFGDSMFQNNSVTNVRGAFVICGGLTTNPRPTITFTDNNISADVFGLMMGPARHLTIVSNVFSKMQTAIMPNGAGYQGTDHNGDYLIQGNIFTNAYYAFQNAGGGAAWLDNVKIESNVAYRCAWFAYGYGWGTNVTFLNNAVYLGGGLNSTILKGQWYLDDKSNLFPPYDIWDYNKAGSSYTNSVSYQRGMRQYISVAQTNSVYCIDDATPLAVPPGAVIELSNSVTRAVSVTLSSVNPSTVVSLASHDVLETYWTGSAWTTNSNWSTLLYGIRGYGL